MTLLVPQELTEDFGADAIIKEARHLRRRRRLWSLGGVGLVILLLVFGLIAFGSGAGHTGKPTLPTGSKSRSIPESSGPGQQARSAYLTLTDFVAKDGALRPTRITKGAITLNHLDPSAQDITSEFINYSATGLRSVALYPPAYDIVNGTAYFVDTLHQWAGTPRTWIGSRDEAQTLWNLPIESSTHDFRVFKEAALGPVARIGVSRIGGIVTTEYHATVSLPKLYAFGQSGIGGVLTPGLVQAAFASVNGGSVRFLSLSVDLWVDSTGRAIQAQSFSATEHRRLVRAPSGGFEFAGPEITSPAQSDLFTLSDFGAPVHAVSPPAKRVSFQPGNPSILATGQLIVRRTHSSQDLGPSSLLVSMSLSTTSHSGRDTDSVGTTLKEFVTLHPSGSYSIQLPITLFQPSNNYAGHIIFSPILYVGGTRTVPCNEQGPISFSSRRTTVRVNFLCGA